MLEILGFVLFTTAVLAFTSITPWLRRQPAQRWIDRWMIAELTAVLVVTFGTFGLSLIVAAILNARNAGDFGILAASVVGLVAVLSAGVMVWRRTERRYALPQP